MDHSKVRASSLRAVDRCCRTVEELLGEAPLAVMEHPGSSPVSLFSSLLSSLSVVVRQRLLFSPRIEYLYASTLASQAIAKSAAGSAAAALEVTLQEARVRLLQVERQKAQQVKLLRQKRDDLDKKGREAVALIRKDTAARDAALRMASSALQGDLRDKLVIVREEQGQLEEMHKGIEAKLREKRRALEREVHEAIQGFDAAMADQHRALDQLLAQHRALLEQLKKQKAVRDGLKSQHDVIVEEKKKEEEERLAAVQVEFRMEHSARIIQRAWQHYKIKKMLKKVHKKGRKKKSSIAK